jgi:hypothetical protein
MGKRIRQAAAGIILASALIATAHNSATADQTKDAKWSRYELTTGTGGYRGIDVVWIKSACIGAEDSAGHLRLVGYANGVAHYGCTHSGY